MKEASLIRLLTSEKLRKLLIDWRDGYTISCLLDYPYFKENHKLIAINLNKKQVLDAHSKAIQKINFTGNLDQA